MITIKRILGKAHDAAGFGDVAEFCGEVEKSGLVFDDVLIETFHGETPWAWCPVDGAFTLPSKRSSPFLLRGNVRLSRDYLIFSIYCTNVAYSLKLFERTLPSIENFSSPSSSINAADFPAYLR